MRYFQLLRRPAAFLLWIGQVTSTAGDRLYGMAVLWLALELTGSTKAMAAVSLFESIPLAVVGLVGGALLDRWDRLRTMIAVDLIRAVLVMALPAAYLFGSLKAWHLMALGIGMGSLGALFRPALDATLPSLVTKQEFPGFAGLMDTPSRIARLLGPGFAGVLLTLMPTVHFFSLDAATFMISALSLLAIAVWFRPRQEAPVSHQPRRSLREDLPVGFRLVGQNRSLLAGFLVDGIGNVAFCAYTLGAPLLATERLGSDVGGYGLLIAAYGLGSLFGNVAVGNVDTGRWRAQLMLAGWTGIGVGFSLLGVVSSLPWAIAVIALSGASGSISHVSRATFIGENLPKEHLGKVYSLQNLWSTLCGAAGMVICGWVLDLTPVHQVIGTAGLTMVVASGIALVATARRAKAVVNV